MKSNMSSEVPRRRFIKAAAMAAGGSYIASRMGVAHQGASPPSREKLTQFRYRDVKLTPGPLKDQFDRVQKAYLELNEDQLLKVFRQRAHLAAPGDDMGGWYDAEACESISTSRAHFETPCGAYAHFKLGRYLVRFTGDARYGDGIERVLYNTVLGAKDPKGDGYFFYYSDYHPSTQKGYHPDKWPCCSGTLPQAVADYLLNIYFQSPDGLYVNLYVPSEVRWNVQGTPAKLIQATNYPESDSSELRLELSAPADFTVFVRIPGWLESPPQLSVNGKSVSVPAEPRSFAALRRRWQHNDTIQVKLPFTFRTLPVDDQHPQLAALMRGPLMLVALTPEIKLSQRGIAQGELKPTPYTTLSFELQTPQDRVRFVPFYTVKDEIYSTYVVM